MKDILTVLVDDNKIRKLNETTAIEYTESICSKYM